MGQNQNEKELLKRIAVLEALLLKAVTLLRFNELFAEARDLQKEMADNGVKRKL